MKDPELSRLLAARRVPQPVKDHIGQRLVALIRHGTMSQASSDRYDQVDGWPTDPTDGTSQRQALRFQHYGVFFQPPPQAEMIVAALSGGGNNLVTLASYLPGCGPDDLEDGEGGLYTIFNTSIAFLKDGSVTITDASGGTATLKDGVLTVSHDVAARHYLGTGDTPTITYGGSVIATPATTVTGTDSRFRVPITTTTNVAAGETLFSATLATALPSCIGLAAAEQGPAVGWTVGSGGTSIAVTASAAWPSGTVGVVVVSTEGST